MTKSADNSGKQRAKDTVELPAITPEGAPMADAVESPPADMSTDDVAADEATASSAADGAAVDETNDTDGDVAAAERAPEAFLQEEPETGPDAEMSGPAL